MGLTPRTPGTDGLNVDPLAGRDPALDGVRAVACLLIYFYHLGLNVIRPPLVVEGFTGVTVFFVLSGYLLYGPFAGALLGGRTFPGWRSYLIRRLTRIYPPYLASLAVYTAVRYALEAIRPGGTRSSPPGLGNLASHALLVFNYGDRREFYGICGVFWSLAIEAQFYWLLPIVCAVAFRLGARGRWSGATPVLLFGAVGPVSRALESRYFVEHHLSDALPRFVAVTSYLDLFAAGMALAVLSKADGGGRWRAPAVARWAILGLGVAGFLAAENWSLAATNLKSDWQTTPAFAYTVFYPSASSASSALVLLALVTRPGVGAGPLTWRPLVRLGEVSYSLYLYHVLVQMGVILAVTPGRRYPGPWENFNTALLALVPTLVVAALGYRLVERPALAWGLKHSSHPAAARRGLVDTSTGVAP